MIIVFFYLAVAICISLFIFVKIGPPWIGRYIQEDDAKTSEIESLEDSIQGYYYKFKKLPYDLTALSDANYFNNLEGYQYSITGVNTYKICATFKTNITEGITSSVLVHKVGFDCFNLVAQKFTTQSPESLIPNELLTCKTLNTEMVIDPKGFGYIGCDMEVTGGVINLSKSYCESQITHQKEYLVPDTYGRRNRYWATLTGLDPKEIVKVYGVDYSGNKVECLPDLNL
ncbi:MAG TPA: hypothetical protein VG895_01365 [Patescibacteria group bacterium]|nr:hypothetical protein [Patescibacteria group bacterium]